MIEWKEWDGETYPTADKTYLVVVDQPHGGERYMSVAIIDVIEGKTCWRETMDGLSLHRVTHYAEINLPKE
jgi:hypothetical protein